MGNTLIAYQKWEDMAEYILKCVVNQLPKSERYALGEQIRRLTVGIGVHIGATDIQEQRLKDDLKRAFLSDSRGDLIADASGIILAVIIYGLRG